MNLKKFVKNVDNFPIPNKTFHDITPLMKNGEAFHYAIDQIIDFAEILKPDVIVGPEARGFIIGCPLSFAFKIGFIPVRKPNKLPRETIEYTYELEYGTDTLCMHIDAIEKGQKVLIVDDVLATGGTVNATANIIKKLGGEIIGCAFLLELLNLNGRETLKKTMDNVPVKALMQY